MKGAWTSISAIRGGAVACRAVILCLCGVDPCGTPRDADAELREADYMGKLRLPYYIVLF